MEQDVKNSEIKLKTLEAYTRDVGRFHARIDYDTMDIIHASTGGFVLITGKTNCVAKCLPLYPSDEGKHMIRIDGLIRSNCGIQIGDEVTIKKIKVQSCVKFTVRPLETIPPIDERYIVDALDEVAIIKNQTVMIPYFGGRLVFSVVDCEPEGPVLILHKSQCTITETEPTNTGYVELDNKFLEYRKELVEQLKGLVKSLDIHAMFKVVESIAELDQLRSDVKAILEDKTIKPKVTTRKGMTDLIEQALKDALENMGKKK